MRGLPSALVVMLLLGVAVRLAVAWAPFDGYQAERGPLVDDSFYYFQIARNIATGAGPTHDGASRTSGFQPLWMLALVPLYLAAPDDPILPIHLAMTLQALLAALSAVLLWRLGRHLAGQTAGRVAAGTWLASPYIIDHGMNGMETALAAVTLLGVLAWYLERIRGRWAETSRRDWALLGLLGGLAFLSRVDSALLLAALAVDLILGMGRRVGAGPLLRASLWSLVGFSVVVPWVGFCLAVSGTLLPESGRAVRLLATLYSTSHLYGAHTAGEPGFYLDNLGLLLRNLLSRPEVPPLGAPVGILLRRLDLPVWTNLLWSAAAAAGLWWAWRRSAARGRFPGFLWGAAALYLLAYAVVVPGQWFYARYLFPVVTLGILLAGITAQVVLALPSPAVRRLLVGAGVLLLLTAVSVDGHRRLLMTDGKNIIGYVETARMIDDTPWIQAPVGVFQAGVVGYMARKDILALDGKVNAAAFEALEAGTLTSYLQDQGVATVTDLYPWMIDLLFDHGARHDDPVSLQRRTVSHPARPFSWLVVTLPPSGPAPGGALQPRNGI
ncbi:MAG: glycosyltransferase family 39 protein [Pseudomonadota bacterium]